MPNVEEGKFVRMFDRHEIRLTACAVTKSISHDVLNSGPTSSYFREPNQFWQRDPKHERAAVKFYKRDIYDYSASDSITQTVRIRMPFLGHNSTNGWGELQLLIKEPRLVMLARHRSFDTRVNKWVPETKLIQPKTDFGTHAYLALRFYHQGYLPPVPSNWRFEPVYVSIINRSFYKIDVLWEKEEITITVALLDKNLPEIPKHLK